MSYSEYSRETALLGLLEPHSQLRMLGSVYSSRDLSEAPEYSGGIRVRISRILE